MVKNMEHVLLIEDDTTISSSIQYYLETEGFKVTTMEDGSKVLQEIKSTTYQIIILDITLKEENGFEVFKKIKSISDIPVIFLTALDEEINIVRGLEMGADDYITKPFRARELVSRIKTVLRRCNQSIPNVIYIGNLKINMKQASVYKNKENVFLTALEYKILLILLENRGQVLTREQILSHIWDVSEEFVNDNTLTVYIKRLREKIEEDSNQPKIIKTVRGIGYIIEA